MQKKRNLSVIKTTDLAQLKNTLNTSHQICSRCLKKIKGEKIIIKANIYRTDRQRNKIYIYHPTCIEQKIIRLVINYIKIKLLYTLERKLKASILRPIFKKKRAKKKGTPRRNSDKK